MLPDQKDRGFVQSPRQKGEYVKRGGILREPWKIT